VKREGRHRREAKEKGNKDRKGMTGPGKLKEGIGKDEEKRIDPSAEIFKFWLDYIYFWLISGLAKFT